VEKIQVGIKNTENQTVIQRFTTRHTTTTEMQDAGVLTTPSMIMLMEHCAQFSVEDLLDEGCTTVGILVNVRHLSAAPMGTELIIDSELTEIDRKKLTFKVAVHDQKGKAIGEGFHERFIVDKSKFSHKALEQG
jgi:predicted thioesterase